jgi:hypothetical protein
MRVFNWFWDKIYEVSSREIFDDYSSFACGNMTEQYIKVWSAKHASPKDHFKHKYLLIADGNTAAWLRYPMVLLSGSVPLKIDTREEGEFIQWFSNDL